MKLHLGCGGRYLRGFYHIDMVEFPHVDLVTSINRLDSIMDESCDLIYTSHAFEYFDRFQAVDVLGEWHRVLRNGGELLIAVPDFPKLIMVYQRTNDLESIIGPLFGRWQVGDEEFIYHRTVWDFATLSAALTQAGFGEVEEYNPIDFLNSIDGDFDDHSLAFYPHFERTGIQISLCLRATKT